MRKVLVGLLVPLLLTACNFSKSVKKDFVTGLTASGDGLSCEDIYLSVNDEKINRNTFIYGEKVYVNFSDIQGFTKEGDNSFPAMRISVTGMNGDTIFKIDDLYAEYNGISYSPLLLSANIIVADPMHSNNDYTLYINIEDKKGDGTFDVKFPFSVRPNDKIIIEPGGISYGEIYLFEESQEKVITDNIIGFDQNIYMIFEGVEGLKEENGIVYPGLSLKLTDKSGNALLDYENLFAEYGESGIDAASVKASLSAHFNITGTGADNPLRCEVLIWDLKGDSKIKASAEMTIR